MIENTVDSTCSKASPKLLSEGRQGPVRELTIEVSKAERLIHVKLAGTPRQECVVMMLNELNALVEKDSSLSVLIDETELDPSFVRPGDMERFVAAWLGASALRATRLAVFVSDNAMYGLNRMFEGMAEAYGRISVFSDRARAEAWLREERPETSMRTGPTFPVANRAGRTRTPVVSGTAAEAS